VGGMAKTFTLDAARRALATDEATRNISIIPGCTADQMREIEQRIRSTLDQRAETGSTGTLLPIDRKKASAHSLKDSAPAGG